MKKFTAMLLLLAVCMMAGAQSKLTPQAQWRVGLTGGATYNTHSVDLQYQNDVRTEGRWGGTLGISGQYNVTDWLGVRADLNWAQKNHRRYRSAYNIVDYKFRNNYLQLPVMASFSFGGKKLRGFSNLGIYGGYWLNSTRWGTDQEAESMKDYNFSEKVELGSDYYQRWDFGFVGGVGLEYRFCPHWAAQVELRYYYSTTSTQKQYMRVNDYRYNGTTAMQMAVYYIF